MTTIRLGSLLAVSLSLSSPALAQSAPTDAMPVAAEESMRASGGASVRSYQTDWMVNPLNQLEIGTSFRFLMAPESGLSPDDDGELRFTDVGIARVDGRYSFLDRFEATVGLEVLAKQPSYLDESVFHGADLGVRMALASKLALWAHGAGGTMLDKTGLWIETAAGAQARTSIDETIRFQATLGGAFTQLLPDEGDAAPWFVEVAAHLEGLLRAPRGEIAGWIGIDYRLPVADQPDGTGMDPNVRLGFVLGMMLGYVDNWDLYTALGWNDRGDVEDPSTTLPILDGGFDQTTIMFGANRRWDMSSDQEKEDLVMQLRNNDG